jgi:hypothetical protein
MKIKVNQRKWEILGINIIVKKYDHNAGYP